MGVVYMRRLSADRRGGPARGAKDGVRMVRPRARSTCFALIACATVASLWPPPVEAAPPLVSPSGAGTVVIGPQAMEGNLQIHPGDALRAGFDFTMPASHPTATGSIYNASMSLLVTCSNGSAPALSTS